MPRLLTGLALSLALVAAVFWLPALPWLLLLAVLVLLCAVEFGRMLEVSAPGSPVMILPPVVLLTIAAMLHGHRLVAADDVSLLTTVVVVLPAAFALLQGIPERAWPAVPWLSFGALYLAAPAVAIFRLREDSGPWLVFLLLGIIGLGDSAAYYCGKAFGKRKLAPRLSPKKTWAGSLGGVSAAILFALGWSLLRLERLDLGLLLLAAVTQGVGQFGDLLESAMKRTAGVKDSGGILPGHGGLLDRADALLLAAPVFCLGVRLFGGHWG